MNDMARLTELTSHLVNFVSWVKEPLLSPHPLHRVELSIY